MPNLEERLKILDEIKKNSESTETKLNEILLSLGWDKHEFTNEDSTKLECPYDSSHLVSPEKIDVHITKCKMHASKLDPTDLLFPESFNTDPASAIKIDEELSAKIISEAAKLDVNFRSGIPDGGPDNRPIPLSYNQMIASFTPDERRALYDYVISRTERKEVISDYSFLLNPNNDDKEHPKSALEELAMIRDMKRRRAKYKVSTKSKSYTEVMRGVIENLMTSHEEDVKAATKSHKSEKRKHDKYDETHFKHKSKKHKS